MCRRVQCPSCQKPTFAGCGMHVEQVLGDVPKQNRCHCHEKKSASKAPAPSNETTSWLKNLIGK